MLGFLCCFKNILIIKVYFDDVLRWCIRLTTHVWEAAEQKGKEKVEDDKVANEDGCKGVRITQGKFGKKPSRKSGGGSFKRRSIRLQNRNSGALDNVSIASGGGPLPGIGPGGRPANRQRSIGGNRDSDVECKFTDLYF